MKIGLIACVKTKRRKKSKVKDLYISPLFKKALKYCLLNYDKVFILSAKHGVLELNEIIEPYEMTVNNFNKKEKKLWSYKVIKQLEQKSDLKKDLFFIHAGINYRQYIIQKLKNYKIPLEGVSFGNQLKFYKENV